MIPPQSARKRLIVYDLDGTLVDTREDISASANHLRAEMGLPPLPQAQICGYVGLGLRKLVANVLGTEEGPVVEEGMRLYRAHYAEHMLDHTVLYPGALDLLEHFRDRAQAVITNKPNPYSREILEALGVARCFVEIVAGDSGWPKKPDPESLLAILQREGIPPEEALLVGDSPIDVETGVKAGVLTVAVAHGFTPHAELESARPAPTALVSDLRELLSLARARGW